MIPLRDGFYWIVDTKYERGPEVARLDRGAWVFGDECFVQAKRFVVVSGRLGSPQGAAVS